MRPPRTSVLLLPAGLALGHAFGYLAAGGGHHAGTAAPVGHGYLGAVVRVAVPLAIGVVAWAFAGGARRAAPRPLRWEALAAQLMALFLAVEVVEHALAGLGPAHVLHAPTTVWGVVGQLLAAWLVTAVVRAAHAAGRRIVPEPRPRVAPVAAPRSFPRPTGARAVARDAAATWAALRAPPAVVG